MNLDFVAILKKIISIPYVMFWESASGNYSDSGDFFFRFTVLVVLSAQIKKKKNENGNC